MNKSTLLQEIESTYALPEDASQAPQAPSVIERLILKHAMRSFGRRGYAATTLRGIATDARVTAPMVSYYFKSKEKLFHRVAEIVMDSLEAEVARALERPLPFYEAIHAIARAHVDLVERSPAAIEFMLSMLYGPQEGQPTPDLDKMYQGTGALIHDTFEKGIASGEFQPRPGVTARFLVEQFGTLVHDYVLRRFKYERLLERLPDRRAEIEARRDEMTIEIALDYFFFGVGDVTDRPIA